MHISFQSPVSLTDTKTSAGKITPTCRGICFCKYLGERCDTSSPFPVFSPFTFPRFYLSISFVKKPWKSLNLFTITDNTRWTTNIMALWIFTARKLNFILTHITSLHRAFHTFVSRPIIYSKSTFLKYSNSVGSPKRETSVWWRFPSG